MLIDLDIIYLLYKNIKDRRISAFSSLYLIYGKAKAYL